MKGFSIIIVTWNGLHHLREFLPSVVETDYPDYEIIIADNNSEDGSKEWLKERYPEIKIAAFDDNYGYTGGNNRAVPYASKEILLFLNNDVKVTPDWLHGLNDVFESDEKVAVAQPKLLSYKEPHKFEYAGAAGGFIDKYGYPFCRGRLFEHVEEDNGQYDDESDIFWASGAAFAIRKEVFIQSGGFDEDFQFHMEEIDLCWRIQNQGHRVRYTPDSVVYHLGGGSLPMGSPRKVYFNFRNSLTMLWKNYSGWNLLKRFKLRLLLDQVAGFRALFTGKPSEFWAVQKAQLYFIGNFISHIKDRKELKLQRINLMDPETMLNKSIVWSYFLKKKRTFKELTD